MHRQFWVVWRDGGGAPTAKHDTQTAAIMEAERLARGSQGYDFFVLEARSVSHSINVMTERLHAPNCTCGDCIPF